MNKKIFFVLPFVLVSLVLGVLAGLFRMGWSIPIGAVAGEHGALMTGSFLGTLICLERIVALKKKWMYIIPVISGLSLIFFLLEMPQIAMSLLTLASFGLIYIYVDLIKRFGEYYFYVMMLGAIGWAVGPEWSGGRYGRRLARQHRAWRVLPGGTRKQGWKACFRGKAPAIYLARANGLGPCSAADG